METTCPAPTHPSSPGPCSPGPLNPSTPTSLHPEPTHPCTTARTPTPLHPCIPAPLVPLPHLERPRQQLGCAAGKASLHDIRPQVSDPCSAPLETQGDPSGSEPRNPRGTHPTHAPPHSKQVPWGGKQREQAWKGTLNTTASSLQPMGDLRRGVGTVRRGPADHARASWGGRRQPCEAARNRGDEGRGVRGRRVVQIHTQQAGA